MKKLSAYHKATETEKAWAAGFFDGEGCIHVNRIVRNNGGIGISHALHVTMAQRLPEPLELIHGIWGGVLSFHSSNKAYQLQMCKADGIRFLKDVLPYLVVKREQALLIMELGELTRSGRNVYNVNVDEIAIHEAYRQAIVDAKRRRFD